MAEKLTFNLVSPESELYSGAVDEVIIPGSEGEIGVLAKHSPLMTTLFPGMLVIRDNGSDTRIYVQGGFADITPEGLTVLAEKAIPAEEMRGDVLAVEKQRIEEVIEAADNPEASLAASRAKEVLAGL